MVPAGFFIGFAALAVVAFALSFRAYWKAASDRRDLCETLTAVICGAAELAKHLEVLVKARQEETYCSCGVCSIIDAHTIKADEPDDEAAG